MAAAVLVRSPILAVPPTTNPGSMLTPPGQPMPMQAGEYTPSMPPNIVTFSRTNVTPPSPLYIQRDDVIGIFAFSRNVNEILSIGARFLRVDGVVVNVQQNLSLGSTPRTAKNLQLPEAEGWLLGISCVASVATKRGNTYAVGFVQRGSAGNSPLTLVNQVLFADYVSQNCPIGWPGSRVLDKYEGPGLTDIGTMAASAIGSDFSFSFSAGLAERVTVVQLTLVTSATVNNRLVKLRVKDGLSGQTMDFGANAAQPASKTVIYTWGAGMSDYTDALGNQVMPLPLNLWLIGSSSTLATITALLDTNVSTGDQWTVATKYSEAYLDF